MTKIPNAELNALLAVMSFHIGEAHGIHARELAEAVYLGDASTKAQRRLRHAIEQLRRDGHHICGRPESGYFIAASDAELDGTCKFLYERAMTTLQQIAAMKRVSLPDLRGQLRLPT